MEASRTEKVHSCKTSNEEEVVLKSIAIDKEIISTLPQDNGWKLFQPLCLYQGFWLIPAFVEGLMFAQDYFKAQPDHIFVCSAMKTGTTWLKALTYATVTRTNLDNAINQLLTKVPHDCIPFLEKDYIDNYPTMPETGHSLWSTHLPYASLPKSIIDSDCKIIYICMDPKDVFVSLWYHMNKRRPTNHENISFEEAFELFCNGTSTYGPYWDHVLEYWKASLACPNRVLFLKYEDMKIDTVLYLKKLAEFIGHPFSLDEESEGAVQKIIELCSFENLSNLEVNKTGKHRPNGPGGGVDNNVFFRKGKIGDWKNHLTIEMGARLDNIMENKLSGSGLTFN